MMMMMIIIIIISYVNMSLVVLKMKQRISRQRNMFDIYNYNFARCFVWV
jgi:hypothetical protein